MAVAGSAVGIPAASAQVLDDLPPLERWFAWLSARLDAHRNSAVAPAAISDTLILRDGDYASIHRLGGEYGNWRFRRGDNPSTLKLLYEGGDRLSLTRGGRPLTVRRGERFRVNADLVLMWRFALPYGDRVRVMLYDGNTVAKPLWGLLQNWYDYNPAYRTNAVFDPFESALRTYIPSPDGLETSGVQIGVIILDQGSVKDTIPVYTTASTLSETTPVTIYFRDQSNDDHSFTGGRILSHLRLGDLMVRDLRIDFNYAHNPYCAILTEMPCPRIDAPPVKARIEAGERRPTAPIHKPPLELLDLARSLRTASGD